MAGENVKVTLSLEDKISSKLRDIGKQMDKVVLNMDSFGQKALVASENTTKLADNLERMAKAYKEISAYSGMKLPSGSVGSGTTPSNPAIRSIKTDSGYGTKALRNSTADLNNLIKRLNELPKGLEYNFIGLSDRIDRVTRNLKSAYATGEQFAGVLRKMDIPNIGTGLSAAMQTAQRQFSAQLSYINSMQDKLANGGVLSVGELTQAYSGLAEMMKRAKDVQSELTEVITSGKLSTEQVSALKAEYDKYMNSVKATTQAVIDLGSATDTALDSPELKQAVKDFEKAEKESRDLAEAYARLQKETQSTSSSTRTLNTELTKTSTATTNAKSGVSSLTSSLKGLAASFISVYSAQKLIETSDSLILSEGKLRNLTDNVEQFSNSIYQMSQDTRTSYLDNMSQMAKMWQLTGGSSGIFDTEEKLLQFNEVLNKAFILGGSGTREINASLYQLTQALSSGRLQGDELRSLAENAPYLINSVTDSLEKMYNAGKDQSEWIELSYADLKELGAQGVLTSDLIVDAVLSSTEEIREAYENLTPTFEQIFETIKNQAIKISEPLLKKLNEVFNSEAFAKTAQVLMKILAMLVAAFTPILEMILWIGEVMADNWSIFEPIIWGIVGALAVYAGALLIVKTYTLAVESATKLLAGVTSIIQGISKAYQGWILASALIRQALGRELSMKQYIALTNYKQALSEGAVQKTKLDTLLTTAATTKATLDEAGAKLANAQTSGIMAGAESGATIATVGLAGAMKALAASVWAAIAPLLIPVLILAALIAVIYLAVKAWNYYTDDTLTMLGAVAAGVAWVAGWICNAFILIYNVAISVLRYIAAGIVALGAAALNLVNWIVNGVLKAANMIAAIVMGTAATINNIGVGLWNGLVSVAEGITNAFIAMKNVLHNIFVSLFGWIVKGINGVIEGLNALVDGYNKVSGALGGDSIDHFGTVEIDMDTVDISDGFVDFSGYKGEYKDISSEFNDGLHMFDGYFKDYVDVGKTFDDTFNSLAGMEDWKANYVDVDEWVSSARKWGDDNWNSISNSMSKKWDELFGDLDYMTDLDEKTQDILDGLEGIDGIGDGTGGTGGSGGTGGLSGKNPVENYNNSLPNYDSSSLGGSNELPSATQDAINKISGNTDDIADAVTVTDEQLELLRELAERRAINRFTTAEISITNNMSNTINSEMDMDGVVNYLTNELNKSLVAGAESANHY